MRYSSDDAATRRSGWFRKIAMTIIEASDSSLLVVFGDVISPESEDRVLGLLHGIQRRRDSRIRNLHPGYTSLLIDFDPLAMTHDEAGQIVRSLINDEPITGYNSAEAVEIPVCYGADFGLDLADVASHTKLSVEEVVRIHSSATYRVSFLGFTAGFAYLSGMPEVLQTPRLATPRRMVATGSVGIAGGQTGIYPTETPGGWRLIGRTPLRMFNPLATPPTRVQAGDRLRFVAINRTEFERLSVELA
jgi:KipI family sensor histidine kinase inhibitor